MRECFFKHALARKTSKKLKKYLAKTFFFVYNKFIHGWIPEWPKGTDCKSAGDAFEGSNPSPSTTTPEHIRSGIFLSYAKAVRILLHPLLLQSIFALEFFCHTPKRFESFSIHYILNSQVFSHGLIRQYLRNYGVIPIKGLHLFLYLSGFLRIFLFYSFHCINKLLLCRNVK